MILLAGRSGMSVVDHSCAVLIIDLANVVFESILEAGSVGILSDETNVPEVILVALKFGIRAASISPVSFVATRLVILSLGMFGNSDTCHVLSVSICVFGSVGMSVYRRLNRSEAIVPVSLVASKSEILELPSVGIRGWPKTPLVMLSAVSPLKDTFTSISPDPIKPVRRL